MDCKYLRVSKHGVWAIRQLAILQEKAIYRLHASFFNFAHWLNDTNGISTLTVRQSQRLFTEHFARRLICAHDMQDDFICPANPNTNVLAQCVRNAIGVDGGLVPGSMEHGCTECTHRKRYCSDLEGEGAVIGVAGQENVVAGDDLNDHNTVSITIYDRNVSLISHQNITDAPAATDANIPQPPPQQAAPPAGEPRGYV
jgi:hypothetical protein